MSRLLCRLFGHRWRPAWEWGNRITVYEHVCDRKGCDATFIGVPG